VENVGAIHGWQYFPGYDQGLPPRLHALWDAASARGEGRRLLARFGVGYAIVGAREAAALGPPVAGIFGVVLATIPERRPRAFGAARWTLSRDGVDVDETAGPCAMAEPRPERVALRCSAAAPAYAVLLDAWAPGWTATVDGAPAEILRADGYVRAV